jgi:hypothetical protein
MSTSHKDIEAKKAALEHKLRSLEQKLDQGLDDVKTGVTESLSLTKMIRKYPLQSVGLSVVAGLLIATSGKKKGNRTSYTTKREDDVISVVGRSLKKRLTQKAIDTLMDIVEQQLSQAGHRQIDK